METRDVVNVAVTATTDYKWSLRTGNDKLATTTLGAEWLERRPWPPRLRRCRMRRTVRRQVLSFWTTHASGREKVQQQQQISHAPLGK